MSKNFESDSSNSRSNLQFLLVVPNVLMDLSLLLVRRGSNGFRGLQAYIKSHIFLKHTFVIKTTEQSNLKTNLKVGTINENEVSRRPQTVLQNEQCVHGLKLLNENENKYIYTQDSDIFYSFQFLEGNITQLLNSHSKPGILSDKCKFPLFIGYVNDTFYCLQRSIRCQSFPYFVCVRIITP